MKPGGLATMNMVLCIYKFLCTFFSPMKLRAELCISSWSRMQQPYIQIATVLSDIIVIFFYYEEIAQVPSKTIFLFKLDAEQ